VTLLTEQKAAKLIDLIEELRRDLPNVKDRHDPEAASLQQSMNPALVLAALDEGAPEEKAERSQRAKASKGHELHAGGGDKTKAPGPDR
jgi:uncharacterized membrane protein